MSRTFGLNINSVNDENDVTTMAPFGEYFNHRNPPHVKWTWNADEMGRSGWFAIAALEVKKGE